MRETLDIKSRQIVGEVIKNNLDYLVRFATLRIGNKADSEDIVHEAVRRFLETDIARIKPDNLRMYLFRIVYNLCQDFFNTTRCLRPISDSDCDIPDMTKEDELDMEEVERLNRLLDNLTHKEAEVIRMNVMDELSFVEISQILSTPVSTVKSRFKSGMDKLRKQYQNNVSHG